MTDEQISKLSVKPLHFPSVLGGVVPTYNIAGITQDLKFTAETLSGIFLGTITKWDDARLAKDNPGVKLPRADIQVVHRSDGSGTTFVFTDYLPKSTPIGKAKWEQTLPSTGPWASAGRATKVSPARSSKHRIR